MFTVIADKTVLDKLAAIIKDEDEGSCIRLREYTLGCG